MKKQLIALGAAGVVSLLAVNASAQGPVAAPQPAEEPAAEPMNEPAADDATGSAIGVVVGINYANFAYDEEPEETPDSLLGLALGVRYINDFTPNLGVQTGLLYTQHGFSREAGGIEASTTLNYLEVPILLRASYPMGNIRPKAVLGPYLAYFLSGSVETDGEDTTPDGFEDNIASIEYGIQVGAGVEIDAGPGAVAVDVKYVRGLNGTQDPEEGDAPDDNTYNSSIQALVGYHYAF